MAKLTYRNYAEEIAARIIERLEAGTAPWQKPWQAGALRDEAMNPTTGKAYRGFNTLWLEMQGYSDPRWMTYKQAAEAGAQVRKGQKSTMIEYWQWSVKEKVIDETTGEVRKDAEGQDVTRTGQLERPRVFYAMVFNAEQIEGLEPLTAPELPPDGFAPNLEAEKILASLPVPIRHDQGDRAYYHGLKDEIHLPPKGQFISREAYYSTALHELGHATGHKTRLKRDLSGGFGSQRYAREELRAEIGSYMLNTKLGLGHDPSQHASYVQNWIKVLREDPREIFRTARDADLIQSYLLEPELRQKLEQSAQNIRDKQTGKETLMQNRSYIQVPYAEKAEAKAAGAKWDGKVKSWYIPDGKDKAAFAHWPEGRPEPKPTTTPEQAFGDFITVNGFVLKGAPVMDGEWHSVPLEGQKDDKASGSYRGFSDGVANGMVQNHKTGELFKFAHTGQELTAADRETIAERREQNKAMHDELRAASHDQAAKRAFGYYKNSEWAKADHGYLEAKDVQSFGVKVCDNGLLMVPMRNMDGALRSIQFIGQDGKKTFMKGGQKQGMMHLIDPKKEVRNGTVDVVLVAEGYSTAATLHQMTGKPVTVAFDSGNLQSVAEAIRARNPQAQIVLAADNDHAVTIKDVPLNVGIEKAKKAARTVGGQVIFPHFTKAEKELGLTDFNDLARSRGKAARNTIQAAVAKVTQKGADLELV